MVDQISITKLYKDALYYRLLREGMPRKEAEQYVEKIFVFLQESHIRI